MMNLILILGARFPFGFNPSEKNSRQIINLEHVVFGKVVQLCRNMLPEINVGCPLAQGKSRLRDNLTRP
jgi:fumarate reductase subunit D